MRLAPPWRRYFRTLRRVPAPVIRAMGTRDFGDMTDWTTCVCGWAMRDGLAYLSGEDPENMPSGPLSSVRCKQLYGGTRAEWSAIFLGVTGWRTRDWIEEAFVRRVRECV